MTPKERKLWEQAVRILRQNSATVLAPTAEQVPAETGEWTALQSGDIPKDGNRDPQFLIDQVPRR